MIKRVLLYNSGGGIGDSIQILQLIIMLILIWEIVGAKMRVGFLKPGLEEGLMKV